MSTRIHISRNTFELINYKLKVQPPTKEGLIFNYKIDKFYWLIGLLENPKSNNLKVKKIRKLNFIPLDSRFLKEWLGNDYRIYVNYLVNNGFLLQKRDYTEGVCIHYHLWVDSHIEHFKEHTSFKLFTYCFQDRSDVTLLSPIKKDHNKGLKNVKKYEIVEIKLSPKSIIYKKINKDYERKMANIRKHPPHLRVMSSHLKKNLKIRYDEAMEYCYSFLQSKNEINEKKFSSGKIDEALFNTKKQTIKNKYLHRVANVRNIHFGKRFKSLKFKKTNTNKRINTNLTQMASDLRPFIVGYETMSYLDLSNSQPVLLNILLSGYYQKANDNFKVEMFRYYVQTITGNWYEELGKIFRCDREEAKDIWMKIAYSRNNKYKYYKNTFAKSYPNIRRVMDKIKLNNHGRFAIKLQRIESEVFIDEICKKLIEIDIIPYSIHDGVLVPNDFETRTYDIMCEVLKGHLGSVPVISVNEVKKKDWRNNEKYLLECFLKLHSEDYNPT